MLWARAQLIAGAHYLARRDRAIALALFLLPWMSALFVVQLQHHLDGGTIAILVVVSLGLPTLWVIWAGYRGPRQPIGLSATKVVDQLAIAVGTECRAEAHVCRLHDPYPLPVSWTAADPGLSDACDSTCAAGPDDLAGEGGEIVDVLTRVPSRRLVVLGEPGAGKTMLMIRLVLELLARRASGGPVPILASGSILPILDGLDEIPEDVRGLAISQINDTLRLASTWW